MENDLDINSHVIIESSTATGKEGVYTKRYDYVQKINQAQKELAEENDNIIIGSTYPYDHWIPEQTVYESDSCEVSSIYLDEN